MFSLDEYKKSTIKIPLFIYLLVLLIYKLSEYNSLVSVNPFVEKFTTVDGILLSIAYIFYSYKKISYKIFLYFFVFSIFIVLNFVLYYNTHVVYRSMWVISLIPFVYLYAGRKIGTLFTVYFVLFFIFIYRQGVFSRLTLQDVYVFVFSNILLASISYFFVLHLERYTKLISKKYEFLELAANTDELTGVYNRRGFFRVAENKKGVLAIFDLDDFKQVNDRFGHKFGDEYLKFFVKQLENSIRRNDIIGRIGGDEFVVLFEGAELTDIKKWVIKFYTHLDKNRFKNIKISVSSGFAVYEGGDIKDSFVIADMLLYESKKKKNTFTFPASEER